MDSSPWWFGLLWSLFLTGGLRKEGPPRKAAPESVGLFGLLYANGTMFA